MYLLDGSLECTQLSGAQRLLETQLQLLKVLVIESVYEVDAGMLIWFQPVGVVYC